VRIESKREIKGHTTTAIRYYITSSPPSAQKLLHASRSHWRIENEVHWVLDVSFNDDHSRIRKGHAPQNIAFMKSAALNLLKSAQPHVEGRISIKTLRKAACWSPSTLDLIVNQILMR
jgi:predicted transposase YbfD/YdcC